MIAYHLEAHGKRASGPSVLPRTVTAESPQETSGRGLKGRSASARGSGIGLGGGGAGGRAQPPPPERAGGGGLVESAGSDTASAASDINYMHESLRQYHPQEGEEEEGVSVGIRVQAWGFFQLDSVLIGCDFLMLCMFCFYVLSLSL